GRRPAPRLLRDRRRQRQGRGHAPGRTPRPVPDPRRPRHHAGPGRPPARLRRTAPDEDLGRIPAPLPGHRVAADPLPPPPAGEAGSPPPRLRRRAGSTPSPACGGGPGRLPAEEGRVDSLPRLRGRAGVGAFTPPAAASTSPRARHPPVA